MMDLVFLNNAHDQKHDYDNHGDTHHPKQSTLEHGFLHL
jgi:hypothetical protein